MPIDDCEDKEEKEKEEGGEKVEEERAGGTRGRGYTLHEVYRNKSLHDRSGAK